MSAPTNTPEPVDGSGYEFTTDKIDPRLIAIASVVVLGTFMSILDTTIVNVAINTLADDFNSTLATIQWVSTGYMLALEHGHANACACEAEGIEQADRPAAHDDDVVLPHRRGD